MRNTVMSFILLLFLFCSCQNDNESVEMSQLEGKWEVVEAMRNQKMTKTLDGAVFVFDQQSSSLTTNLTGTMSSSPMQVKKNIIIQEIPSVEYTVEELSDTVLHLSMEMRKTPFDLSLKRVE